MDGTQVGSVQVSQDKAATAVRFKRPSKAFQDMILGGQVQMQKLTGRWRLRANVKTGRQSTLQAAICKLLVLACCLVSSLVQESPPASA